MNSDYKILILDDDPDIGTMLYTILKYKGYNAVVVTNPADAMLYLSTNYTDLLIMDMLLSGANGVDVCMSVKADTQLSHTPVMMMSAHPYARIECLGAGANDFISKPFDTSNLLLKMANLLQPAAQG